MLRWAISVAATANRIQLLPAEIIRKGRFDQVFFVDLPNEEERKSIFAIHLKKNRADVGRFDLVFLAKATKGWNGAEIEQIVVSSVVDAYSENRAPTEDDMHRVIRILDRKKERVSRIPVLFSPDTECLRLHTHAIRKGLAGPLERRTRRRSS